MNKKGILYVVATPIGNLEDITLRALRIFKEVDYILCEDTRVTGRLLKHYQIEAKLKRYDAHASEKFHSEILDDLKDGKQVALVSDAGTPCISDPGVLLVNEANREDLKVETIPGASALISAFSISGISGNHFTFLGFAPHKKGRKTFFENFKRKELPIIFYESPHRIMKTLSSLVEHLEEEQQVTVARELTKIHEEIVQGTSKEVLSYFEANKEKQRGEFVLIVS